MSRDETSQSEAIQEFRRTVYNYYREHGRTFPWRETDDPYHILVSEFMLQQTPTGRVEEKYRPFLDRFPSCVALAEAPMRDVVEAWQGLGYNRRAQWLHRSAAKIISDYGGRVPRTRDELMELPGVGPATAGGVLAFAFDIPTVFLETNIRRALIYHFFTEDDDVTDAQLRPVLTSALERENPRRWYYALMDYGAMLGDSHPQLHRRSAHYRRQAPFDGSDRQIRGAILRLLLSGSETSLEEFTADLDAEEDRVARILSDLAEEGMVCEEEGLYRLP